MLYRDADTLVASDFNEDYFRLRSHVMNKGHIVPSRNGDTREILNFKTTITNPTRKCIAGYKRNVNIFFLLAESMWIFNGRRDVEFVEIFNSKMRDYSDDGKVFHAPYGWRMRKYGIKPSDETYNNSKDQLEEALILLQNNPADRRIVISLWNSALDLGKNLRDIPCNSMIMYKIRDNKLHQTIHNRSNDLDWGLTTNIFQFSFIGEIMSKLLDVKYGTQTHNSQSLHLYTDTPLTTFMNDEIKNTGELNNFHLYDFGPCKPLPIEFKFKEEDLTISKKLYWVDFFLHAIILKLMHRAKHGIDDPGEESLFSNELKEFCYNFWVTYQILNIFVDYKKHKSHSTAVEELLDFNRYEDVKEIDVFLLSLNFFMRRILDKDEALYKSTLKVIANRIPVYESLPIGEL